MIFQLTLFVHVAAVIGLFVALGIEWVTVRSMKQATTYEQARTAGGPYALLGPIGGISTLLALASGIYLATTLHFWELGWVKLAVPTLFLVGVAGGILGPRRKRLRAAIAKGDGALAADLRNQLRDKLLFRSLRFRGLVLAALVFEMTAKPAAPSDVVSLGASIAFAFVAALV